jgi:hypothetical protein
MAYLGVYAIRNCKTIWQGLKDGVVAAKNKMNENSLSIHNESAIFDIEKITPKLKTNPNEAFFWSGRTNGFGGADRALEIAKLKKGTTLEGLIEAQGIEMPLWDINNPSSMKACEDVSAAYANQVSGEVRAVVGNQLRPGNIWENVELPRLMSNQKVTKITTIDPEILVETVIYLK